MEFNTSLTFNIPQFIPRADMKLAKWYLASPDTDVHMLEYGIDTDILLKATDGYVKAHRFTLAAFSPILKTMVQNHRSTEEPLEFAMSISALKVLLILLYGAFNQPATWEVFHASVNSHFEEVFYACHKFEIIRLVPTLNSALPGHLTRANRYEMYRKCMDFQRLCEERMGQEDWCCLHKQCYNYNVNNAVPEGINQEMILKNI